jgi:hypothetical protein
MRGWSFTIITIILSSIIMGEYMRGWSSLPFFGFQSLVGVSFYSFLFFFFSVRLLYVCVFNALIKGEIDDLVWFKDRWMVAS